MKKKTILKSEKEKPIFDLDEVLQNAQKGYSIVEVKKPSSRLYKFINFIIKGIVYFLILIHLLLYGWYKYELLSVDLSPYKVKSKSYKSDYYAVF